MDSSIKKQVDVQTNVPNSGKPFKRSLWYVACTKLQVIVNIAE